MIRIVLIEDESLVAKDIQSRLRGAGYDIVGIASRGKEGVAKVDELLPDVVLMDIALKGEIDGVEAAQQIIERFDIPVIYLTVHTDAATVRRATATASYGFIVKPFDELELLAAIEMAVYKHGMEVKARESDKRISEISDALEEVIYETDANGAFTFVNASFLTMFGYTREELEAGLTIFDIVVPDERSGAREVFKRRIDGESIGRVEHTGLRKDGSTFPFTVSVVTIERDGAVVGTRGIILDFTELKRAEDMLHEEEGMLRLVLDTSNDAIGLVDVDGVFLLANEALARRFGVKPAEVTGKKGFAEKPEEVAKLRRAHFARAIATKLPVHFDDEHAGRGLKNIYHPIVAHDGSVTRVAVFSQDITERKRLEDALTRERDQAQLYLDTADVIMVALNREGRITLLNRKGCELLGVTPEQAVGTDWFETFLPEDVRKETRGVFETLIGGDPETHRIVEGTMVTSRGEERIVAWHASLLYDDTGNVIGTLSSGTDVTARASAEQKLRESERHIREITDALPVVVYEADETGRVTFANATAFDMFGYTKEELEGGMSIFQLAAPADRKRARAMFRRRGGGDNVGQVGYTGLRKDGSTFPFSNLGAPIRRGGAIVGIRGIAIDITELERAEEKVREHTRTIEILNRIATEGNRATDVQSFAETATKLACELMHFDIGGVYLIDMDARYATLWYAQGLPKTGQGAVEKIPCQDPPFNAILIDGEPLFAEDYVTFLPQHAPLGIASLASVPLYSQDVIIGVLNVGSATPHTFSRVEKDLLIAIGNEGGTVIAKLQADEALQESERRIREITDALPVVVFEADGTGRITFANATAFDMFGYTKEELEAGMSIFQLIVPDDRERARVLFNRRMSGEDVGRVEFTGLRTDGSTFPIEVRATPITQDATNVGMRGVILDITELTRAEEEIKVALSERETLLKEIHHRVKNNMQIVSSLLSLQAGKATVPETVNMLKESQRQIRSMALIHDKLYRSGSLAEIDFGDYVKSLVSELRRMYHIAEGVITITIDVENVQFNVDTAIPCGLIVNELVTNIVKYAFPDGRTGEATIALHRINGTYKLTVADNGVGFPPDLDIQEADTLGLQLVTALANQLDGTITLDRTKGTTFIITFKPQGEHVRGSGGK